MAYVSLHVSLYATQGTCPVLPASLLLQRLVLPSLRAALEPVSCKSEAPPPTLPLPLALGVATSAAPLADADACWQTLHVVAAVLERRPWRGQVLPMPWSSMRHAHAAAHTLMQVLIE